MKFIAVIFTLLSFQSASAALSGDWIGFGTWKFKGEDPGVNCSPMTMTWDETQTSIALDHGLFDCEVVAMHLDRTEWTLKNSLLMDADNNQVGTYDLQNFEVYMPSPNDKTTIHIKIHREANHIDYQEIWFNQTEKVYVIEGRLFTQGKK